MQENASRQTVRECRARFIPTWAVQLPLVRWQLASNENQDKSNRERYGAILVAEVLPHHRLVPRQPSFEILFCVRLMRLITASKLRSAESMTALQLLHAVHEFSNDQASVGTWRRTDGSYVVRGHPRDEHGYGPLS